MVVAVTLVCSVAVPMIAGAQPGGAEVESRRPKQDRGLYRERRFVVQLYEGFLNRQPSSREVDYWTGRMGDGASPEELVREFMNSEEFFVRQCYLGLLGREPDADGKAGFVKALRQGESRAFVVESIIDSPEFRRTMRR
jgi:hypothetical protein